MPMNSMTRTRDSNEIVTHTQKQIHAHENPRGELKMGYGDPTHCGYRPMSLNRHKNQRTMETKTSKLTTFIN